ncbi:MAG: glycosyltransferase [Clostridia bacterium]|nr:glycosyltransferase [Clostridia bacterium]
MEDKIKFSIIVPVYNAEKYLSECIDSALNQTYPAYEIILIDDGSTDSSGKICDLYAQNNKNVLSLHIKNSGSFAARRVGIAKASGDYCIFLDSDDELKLFALDSISRYISDYNADCIIYDSDRIERGSAKPKCESVEKSVKVIENKRELYKTVLFDYRYNGLCCKAIKSTLIGKTDFSEFGRINLGEDLLESIPVYKNCQRCVITNESLYLYYVNPNSLTQNIRYQNIDADNRVRNYARHFLTDENVLTESDLDEYAKYCLRLYSKDIKLALNTDRNFKANKQLLKKMKKSEYYTDYISKIKIKAKLSSDRFVLWAFKYNLFGLIYLSIKLSAVLRK